MPKSLRWIIIVAWLAMLGVFVYQQKATSQVPAGLEMAAESESGNQQWYGIYVEEPSGERVKIGYAATERTSTSTGYITRASTYMKLAIQGTERVLRTESKILTAPDHRLQYVDFSMRSDLVKFKVLGTMRNNELVLDIETAGSRRRQVLPVPEAPLMPENLAEMLAGEGGLEVGRSVELPFFDPATFRYDKAKVTVVERLEHVTDDEQTIVAFRVETNLAGATAESLVDAEGRTLEQRMAGIIMIREPHRVALTEGWRKKPADIPEIASVRLNRPIENARDVTRLKLRLSNVDFTGMELNDERQTFADGVLTVQVQPAPMAGAFKIPYSGDDTDLIAETVGTALLEVDDPAIRQQAREIVPPGVDAAAAAHSIYNWVYTNIEKKPLISMTSAAEVLMVRRGDCNEHAALFAALARAVGLPAVVHVGLVYLDGAFYYHAWNGVYVGEWISLDATWGQWPADATHLRFATGGLDRQVDLLRLMGKLNIEVLEAQ